MNPTVTNTANARFQFEAPKRWVQADNVRVYRVPTHTDYSDSVTHTFILPTLKDTTPNGLVPRILAICAYPPSFFYRKIRDEITQHEGNPGFSPQDVEHLKDFEDNCDANALLLPGESYPQAKGVFLRGTKKVFPHFIELHEHKQQVLRLCCFGPGMNGFDSGMHEMPRQQDYFRCFKLKRNNPVFANYAFFRWLNGLNKCYVIPPNDWNDWGLREPWDFAIFRSTALIEYHPDRKMCLHVEPLGPDWFWPFATIHRLLSNLRSGTIDGHWPSLWRAEEFLRKVYRPSDKLVALRKQILICLGKLGDALKRFPTSPQVASTIENIVGKVPGFSNEQALTNFYRDLKQGLSEYKDKPQRDSLHKKLEAFLLVLNA